MRKSLRLVMAAGLAGLGGCSEGFGSNVQTDALQTTLGGQRITIPRNAAYDQASVSNPESGAEFVKFKLCPRRGRDRQRAVGCEAFDQLPIDDDVYTLLHAPLDARRFPSLTERPQGNEPPSQPLKPYASLVQTDDTDGSKHTRDYAIERLRLINRAGPSTTDRGWPLVACDDRSQSQIVICVAAFAVRGIFVEAIWRSMRADYPDQRTAWRVSSAVDDKVRALFDKS